MIRKDVKEIKGTEWISSTWEKAKTSEQLKKNKTSTTNTISLVILNIWLNYMQSTRDTFEIQKPQIGLY